MPKLVTNNFWIKTQCLDNNQKMRFLQVNEFRAITEPAEHWDNSKLLLEWESIELYEHHFQAASPHVAVLEAVFVNQAEHCP